MQEIDIKKKQQTNKCDRIKKMRSIKKQHILIHCLELGLTVLKSIALTTILCFPH